jgi:hypothetical protein
MISSSLIKALGHNKPAYTKNILHNAKSLTSPLIRNFSQEKTPQLFINTLFRSTPLLASPTKNISTSFGSFRTFSKQKEVDNKKEDDEKEEEADKEEDVSLIANYRVSKEAQKALAERGITKFFPIQYETYDLVFEGKDIIARGKDLRYMIMCEIFVDLLYQTVVTEPTIKVVIVFPEVTLSKSTIVLFERVTSWKHNLGKKRRSCIVLEVFICVWYLEAIRIS